MGIALGASLRNLRQNKKRKKRMSAVLMLLSLVVVLDVFWTLRQPGLAMAGDATCGIMEHTHSDTCNAGEVPCPYEEHIHSIGCYSDTTADVETPLDWQNMFADYPYTGELRRDLVGIAQTQVGYTESTRNFEVGSDGVRRGYTRYGAWYGAPYGDWSGMFVSFCLHYAGADPNELPGNTGANSMAANWNTLGNYAPVGTYLPAAGDLVFFTDNTAGIVTIVQNATCYVIRGDVDGAVAGTMLSLDDPSISGWGLTGEPIPAEDPQDTAEPDNPDPETEEADLLDISNGPAFFIFAESKAEPQIRYFSFRAPRTATDLKTYLTQIGGEYGIVLLDTNNRELPKDETGKYIATAGVSYKLTLTITNEQGFAPGTYQYKLPDGMQVNGGTGTFTLQDGATVGSWEVTDDGLITLVFNKEMDSRTDVTISATMGIMFPTSEEPLDFDGKITVTIEPPPQADLTTQLNKWANQGGVTGDTNENDPSKLYWVIEIQGREGSSIPGSIITDQLKQGDHTYTESDIAAGIRFVVAEPSEGGQIWHEWVVYPGDPNLTWTETGWTYQIPETVKCWCGDVTLGNEGWIYYARFTSTPDPLGPAGEFWFTNTVTVDGKYFEGWGKFGRGNTEERIIKNGVFHGDAENGAFLWEFRALIPGMNENEKAAYQWQIIDTMRVRGNGDTIDHITNDANHATVTATRNGQTINVPNVKDITAPQDFAWKTYWSSSNHGVENTRALILLCRCNCNKDNCKFWNGSSCNSMYWYQTDDGTWHTNHMCYCWTEPEDTIFTFTYETDDPSLMVTHGGQNRTLQNEVVLQYSEYQGDTLVNIPLDDDTVDVPIPGVFKKELTHYFNGYTANYKITVNESKLALTDGSPLTIHDEMTETLAFISGSLVITTEDAQGNSGTLREGADYTISYDGTGTETDAAGKPVHVLEIVILHPQPVMYTLDYDATLIIPPGTVDGVRYHNSATISLWGEDFTDITEETIHTDVNIAAKSYKVEMFKTCAETGEPLGGATFGLFNEQGGRITSDMTDSNGELLFQTSITEGIILREHELYYMQELKAPPGYQVDDTKYWFCFCSKADASCEMCLQTLAGKDNSSRIPIDEIGKIHVENQLMYYDLPATGGCGIYPFIFGGVLFVLTPLVYGLVQRRKQKRTGNG